MGRICEANRGLGRRFIDEGGSATIRVGKGEMMLGTSLGLANSRFIGEGGSGEKVLGASPGLTDVDARYRGIWHGNRLVDG